MNKAACVSDGKRYEALILNSYKEGFLVGILK